MEARHEEQYFLVTSVSGRRFRGSCGNPHTSQRPGCVGRWAAGPSPPGQRLRAEGGPPTRGAAGAGACRAGRGLTVPMTPTCSPRRKSEGLSGRVLRKLPFLAHALYIQVSPPVVSLGPPRQGPCHTAGRASWGSHSGPSGAALSPLSSSRDGLLEWKGGAGLAP